MINPKVDGKQSEFQGAPTSLQRKWRGQFTWLLMYIYINIYIKTQQWTLLFCWEIQNGHIYIYTYIYLHQRWIPRKWSKKLVMYGNSMNPWFMPSQKYLVTLIPFTSVPPWESPRTVQDLGGLARWPMGGSPILLAKPGLSKVGG